MCSGFGEGDLGGGGRLEEQRQRLTEAPVGGLDMFCCDKQQAVSKWSVFKRFILVVRRSGDYLLLFLFQSEIFLLFSTGREIVPPDWSVCGRPRERVGLKFGSSCGVEKKVRTE